MAPLAFCGLGLAPPAFAPSLGSAASFVGLASSTFTNTVRASTLGMWVSMRSPVRRAMKLENKCLTTASGLGLPVKKD